MSKVPNVALLLETARGYGRQVAMGVAKYSSIHGPWSFLLTPADFVQEFPSPESWSGDAVIARLSTPELEQALLAANLPTVILDMEPHQSDPKHPLSHFADLSVDSAAAAHLAAEHLLERNFPAYAFVGVDNKIWSEEREKAFVESVTKAGYDVAVYKPPKKVMGKRWEAERPYLAEWLTKLPKPVGVMACNDVRGRQVLDACQFAELVVPKEVAVIGVDNDELFCELAHPSLSSVSLNAVAAGYEAAKVLDKMMHGRLRKPARLRVAAQRVVARESTNVFAIDDPSVVHAIEAIRRSKGSELSVAEVVKQSNLSRRDLDTRFQKLLGHSVSAEIQRVKLEQAKVLLEQTDYPVPDVADAAGYSSASYMVQVFRAKLGTTPAKYRASVRKFAVDSEGRSIAVQQVRQP
ncbi:substrate-binding domain-containing protein [Aeoliella sp. SH292]|uniref:AraC family transcriptional regulator n=1 Tax=Aeoliella sp. SH292 TaxID=3454464 RepID=UPI003F977A18